MVKDHSDSERGNPLPQHRLLFPISLQWLFYKHHTTDKISHSTAFVTSVMKHWLEREIVQWVHYEGAIRPSHHERTVLPRSYISLLITMNDGEVLGDICSDEVLIVYIYLWLYGIGRMVKDHSDGERETRYLHFSISRNGVFVCIIPQTGFHIARPLLFQLWSTDWKEK